MSQATVFGHPLSGPKSPAEVAAQVNNSLAALLSANSGISAPSYAVKGTRWIDTSVAGTITDKVYDGDAWAIVDVIDEASGVSRLWSSTHPFVDIASASTTDIGAVAARNLRVTGTTTITSLGTAPSGTMRKLRFAGALILTQSANLLLPRSVSLVTVAGDVIDVVSLGSGVWVVTQALASLGGVLSSQGAVISLTGTSQDWLSLPAGVNRIEVSLYGLMTNGSSIPIIQLGDSGGIETSGYAGSSTIVAPGPAVLGAAYSNGFNLTGNHSNTAVVEGGIELSLLDAASFKWVGRGVTALSNSAVTHQSAGRKATSALLDRIRITTVNGTDTFSSGSATIRYWY